jgi:hypothetical protein
LNRCTAVWSSRWAPAPGRRIGFGPGRRARAAPGAPVPAACQRRCGGRRRHCSVLPRVASHRYPRVGGRLSADIILLLVVTYVIIVRASSGTGSYDEQGRRRLLTLAVEVREDEGHGLSEMVLRQALHTDRNRSSDLTGSRERISVTRSCDRYDDVVLRRRSAASRCRGA